MCLELSGKVHFCSDAREMGKSSLLRGFKWLISYISIVNLIFKEKSSRTQIDFCNNAFTDFDSI